MSLIDVNEDVVNHISLSQPTHPNALFQYTYHYNFPTVATAWLTKYNYEKRTNLSTFVGVEQLDDDRIQFYRRLDNIGSTEIIYEKVIINRADKTIISEGVAPGLGEQEEIFVRHTVKPAENDENKTVQQELLIRDHGAKTIQLHMFRLNIERMIKAINFNRFAGLQ